MKRGRDAIPQLYNYLGKFPSIWHALKDLSLCIKDFIDAPVHRVNVNVTIDIKT